MSLSDCPFEDITKLCNYCTGFCILIIVIIILSVLIFIGYCLPCICNVPWGYHSCKEFIEGVPSQTGRGYSGGCIGDGEGCDSEGGGGFDYGGGCDYDYGGDCDAGGDGGGGD